MIQWFPGHMAKAFKEIQAKATAVDLFIIVLDARAPLSSYNEDFDQIAPHKPRLFVITKIDLADHQKLSNLVSKLKNKQDKIILVNLKQKSSAKKILQQAELMLKPKREADLKKGILKPRLRAIVLGVPNAGKSTLINLLAQSSKAKVGNKPGITRTQQWFNAGKIQLMDTPGILWPKFEDQLTGIKLAIIGSIRIDILPQQPVFNAGYQLLSSFYPEKIQALNLEPSQKETIIYDQLIKLCQNRNFLLPQKKLDLKKGMTFFINYLRDLKGVTYD